MKKDLLYIVHPNSIAEQSSNPEYVKTYLDNVSSAIKSHNGPVIVTYLKRSVHDFWEKEAPYASQWLKSLKGLSNVKLFEELGDMEAYQLGSTPMKEMIDDLYLNDELGSITVGGCFTGHSKITMCVDSTFKALKHEYSDIPIKIRPDITRKAGPVYGGRPIEASRVVLAYLESFK
jgi:hypothetical protein